MLVMLIATGVESRATDWYVNDGSTVGDVFTASIGNNANPGTAALPFATIQFAISVAVAGDIIYVDAGTYTGDVEIVKNVVLRGAKFGIPAGPAAIPVNRGTDESIVIGGIYFGQTRDNITVDGFTVNTGLDTRGIEARGLNSTIINNIVTGIPNPLTQQAGISTRANAPLRLHSYLIRNNHVTGFRFGIYFDGNLENPSEINYNYVGNCLQTAYILTGSNGHLYRGNVSVNTPTGMNLIRGNTTIIENTITGSSLIGIRIVGTANTFGNNIANNFIQNCGVGIGLTDPNPAAVNNQAHYNSFTGNTTNIANAHSDDFDATCNWYETTDPVAIAATISGPVTFVPFLLDGIDSDLITDGFQPTTDCIVVPVILTSFTGQVKNESVVLNWQTASEVNSSHFIIERSTDLSRFTSIGRVSAQGFSNHIQSYSFTDAKPGFYDQPIYYRLNMVDLDGTQKNSPIVKVNINGSGKYVQQVYPNPAKAGASIQVDLISPENDMISVSMININGQPLKTTMHQVIKGSNQLKLTVPVNAKGMLFILIRSNGQTTRVPVLID